MEEDPIQIIDTERKESDFMTKLIVVRHAESDANNHGIYQGQSYNMGLSPLGREQARVLAERLSSFPIDRVISSPLKRTHETAIEVSKVHGCELEFDERIMETNHGVWEGRHKDWISKNHSELYDLWQKRPSQVIFPDGEAFMDTVERVLQFLQQVSFKEDTLLITHDNVIRIMISLINNLHIDNIWEISLETASLNFFEVNRISNKNLFRLLKLNDVSHLEGLRNDISSHAL